MQDRLASLKRLARVQEQMVRHSEWRLAAAERSCRELADERVRIQSYLEGEGALGIPMAKAALRYLRALDGRIVNSENEREAGRTAVVTAKRLERTTAEVTQRVERDVQRAQDDRELAALVEVWLVTKPTSLP